MNTHNDSPAPGGANQPIVEHLTELRKRLILSLYGLGIATLLAYSISEHIFNIVRLPILPYLKNGLVFTHPIDKFMAHLKLSVVCGVILSCPYWLYHIWKFVAPGLYVHERKHISTFIVSGTFLFMLGLSFSYFVALPMAFKFLMGYGGDVDQPMITISEYFGFFTQVTLMFGFAFELPLIIVVLGLLGIVSQKFLREKRRYAMLVLAIICAVITPPDLFSMISMLVPMVLLYEVAVLIVGYLERNRPQPTNQDPS